MGAIAVLRCRSWMRTGDGHIAVAEAGEDLIWARGLIGIDLNLGDRDGIVSREEYARASSEVVGGGLARTRVDGAGDVSTTHVEWRHTKGMPSLGGALLFQDVLYVVRNAIVSAFDPETGTLLRQKRIRTAVGDYYASPVAGDGKIHLANLDGRVTSNWSPPPRSPTDASVSAPRGRSTASEDRRPSARYASCLV